MTLHDLFLSFLGGVFAGLGVSAIIYGSRTLPSSVFGLTSYFQIIYGVFLGWIIFSQLPSIYNYIGIIIVIFAGLLLLASSNMSNTFGYLKGRRKDRAAGTKRVGTTEEKFYRVCGKQFAEVVHGEQATRSLLSSSSLL